ncbi:MAG: hypothetical protein J1F02_04470 [Lachnospiraceae bacterium]|nr:hypothetical protein [Lachnospiraceae bacterium]
MKKKGIFITGGILIVAIVAVSLVIGLNRESTVSMAEQVEDKFALLDSELETDPLLMAQSNPYLYRETEAYKSLVSLGMEAVPVIVEAMNEDTVPGGLQQYLAVIALEEITGTKILENSNDGAVNGEECWQVWKKEVANVDQELAAIIKSDKTDTVKKKEIKNYGIFAENYLEQAVSEGIMDKEETAKYETDIVLEAKDSELCEETIQGCKK